MDENTERIKICLSKLSEDQVWDKPNASSNSIGNLILHLCGNIRQYIIFALGGETDVRERPLEFTAEQTHNKAELFELLVETTEAAKKVIAEQDEEELRAIKKVQGTTLDGVSIILHVVEHYSYHCGQIALLCKLHCNQDLGFYAGQDLNQTN